MGFQISNDDETTGQSISDSNVDQGDSVFIANQYIRPEDTTTSPYVDTGTYLSQQNTFSPILMYIGAGLQIITLIYVIILLNSSNLTLDSFYFSVSSASTLSSIGGLLLIIDAIVMFVKKCSGFSLILWAVFLPYVYYFKRCKANGDSYIIALVIVALLIGLTILLYQSTTRIFSTFMY